MLQFEAALNAIDGHDNGLTYQGKRLRNWWVIIGEYDTAKKQGLKLVEE